MLSPEEDLSGLSDEMLIKQLLKTKDDRYFEHLYDRYISLTYKKCLSYLEDEVDAQDVIQKVWIAVYFALPDFRQESKFSTWIYRIVVNHCLNHLKSRRNFVSLDTYDSPSQKDELQTADTKMDVTNLLARLSKEERVLLNLKFVDDLTYEEIADALELGVSAVKMRINRLKQRLQLQADYE